MKQVLQKPGMDPAFTAESSQLYTNDNACGLRLAGIQRALGRPWLSRVFNA